jgi:acyl carrier protein
MPDSSERLARCFRAVFPHLSESEVVRANTNRTPGWDSLATTNLVAAVEDEFEVMFEADEIDRLNSFEAFAQRLSRFRR